MENSDWLTGCLRAETVRFPQRFWSVEAEFEAQLEIEVKIKNEDPEGPCTKFGFGL